MNHFIVTLLVCVFEFFTKMPYMFEDVYYAVPIFNYGNPDFALQSSPTWIRGHFCVAMCLLWTCALTLTLYEYGREAAFKQEDKDENARNVTTVTIRLEYLVIALHLLFSVMVGYNFIHLVHLDKYLAIVGNVGSVIFLSYCL